MVYTHKHPALLIMGLVMLAIGASVSLGWQDGLIKYLGLEKMVWEMTSLTYIFGGIAVVVGLWHPVGKHEEGNLDYYLSTVAGGIFILLIAMLVRWYLAPYVAVLSKGLGPVMGLAHGPVEGEAQGRIAGDLREEDQLGQTEKTGPKLLKDLIMEGLVLKHGRGGILREILEPLLGRPETILFGDPQILAQEVGNVSQDAGNIRHVLVAL